MKIQPYRIVEIEEVDNFNTRYEFIIHGTNKKPYKILIELDNFNQDNVLDLYSCECPDFKFRGNKCKHITESIKQLSKFIEVNQSEEVKC